ncbi:Phage minor structural protein GP20 [Paenibacillus algorifonticola]|uniref:Phage minor structural protein GP20 n=1 Tax=Paenibacillus algorifonticola TaxID=684063 RepID=A0A1I2H2U3_9BACL|nr:phage scaffolding protein [Paenibacillus algorifonticola]SFF23011.1 Phage minor structural protein GP20 [Paenibacillus algorifonticola]
MEWLKDLLKAQGLTDAQITAVVGGVETNYKSWVPEHRFKEINDAKKQAEKNLVDRDKQLEDLKKSSGDTAELTKKIETLQAENKTNKEQYEADAKQLRVSTAIKLALAGKVHDLDIVAGQLDSSKIELDEAGNVKGGLDDQITTLQKDKGFLFVPEDKGGNGSFQFKGAKPNEGGGAGGSGGGKDEAAELGKRVAEFAKTNAAAAEGQKLYFG